MAPKEPPVGIQSMSNSLWQVETFRSEGNLIMAANLLGKLEKVIRSEASKNRDSMQIKILLDRCEICRIRLTQAMTKDIPDDFLK